jgi:uncharacterized RDD family membrane protein YckC
MDGKQIKAGFWRRLAAAWIDLFIVYSISSFLIAISGIVRIRLALEPVFLVIAALYGTVFLIRQGQTIGKSLLGISVANKTGEAPGPWAAIVREVIGKWGIAVVLPVVLGMTLVGRVQIQMLRILMFSLPLLLLLCALLLLFVYYLIARRTWYDQLAGTNVLRVSGSRKSAKAIAYALIGSAILGLGVKAAEYTSLNYIPCRLSIYRSMCSTGPYKAFLQKSHAAPVDYIIGLFDQYDVVVLCERMHPEASQWDFIFDVVRDPRFIERIGNVFTEYGQAGMQSSLDSFMLADSLDAAEIHDHAVHLMRNMAVWPTLTNTNFYTYLTRLYGLNQSLPHEKRVRHFFSDSYVNWTDLKTPEDYRAYERSLNTRDGDMAQHIIDEMRRLAESKIKRPKCLVIMNYRHAFDLTGVDAKAQKTNTYEYLKEAFGSNAANVLLNTPIIISVPVAGGLWDAAFEETGNRPAGFDFESSPFGEDPFDMSFFNSRIKRNLKYKDVFTGFVFVNPADDQYSQTGIPGYYKGFEDEARRRAKLLNADCLKAIEMDIKINNDGIVPLKKEHLGRKIESLIEVFILGLNCVGLVIGLVTLALSSRRGKDESR